MKYKLTPLFVLLVVLGGSSGPACYRPPEPRVQVSEDYQKEVRDWRAERAKDLRKDGGWLQLAGFFWLKQGDNRIGSAENGEIVLPARSPARIGSIRLTGEKAVLRMEQGVLATMGEQAVSQLELKSDGGGARPADRVRVGDFTFLVIERGGRLALRLYDKGSDMMTRFSGLEYFELDPAWRISARFEAYPEPRQVELTTVVQTTVKATVPGEVIFEIDGRERRLLPLAESGDDGFFFVFADKTSGDETYGGGRFLYSDLPVKGRLVLDFNKAYNPPCAFTRFATCPLPRRENRLGVMVLAGEKKYHKGDQGSAREQAP